MRSCIMKRLLTVMLVVSVFLSMSVTASATETQFEVPEVSSNTIFFGENVLTKEQNSEYLASLSSYDLQKIAEKEEYATQISSARKIRAGSLITVPNTYTMYQQETDNYCIPATVKSILMYINGSSPSQATIADTTGTDPTKIPGYLNDRQDACYYVYTAKSNFDQDGMCSKLYSTIVNNKVPASMGISGTTSSNWYYATNGHSLAVFGIYDDYSYIRIGDPLGDRVAGCPYFYSKTASACYNVCTRLVW